MQAGATKTRDRTRAAQAAPSAPLCPRLVRQLGGGGRDCDICGDVGDGRLRCPPETAKPPRKTFPRFDIAGHFNASFANLARPFFSFRLEGIAADPSCFRGERRIASLPPERVMEPTKQVGRTNDGSHLLTLSVRGSDSPWSRSSHRDFCGSEYETR